MKPKLQVHYCKGLKHTGKPIIVKDLDSGTEYNTSEFSMKNVTIKMKFNNATGKAKASGSTTVLEIYKE